MRQPNSRDRLKRITNSILDLPTLPTVIAKIIESVDDPQSSANTLGRLINCDQVLASKVLRMANSVYYGLRTPASTINLAIVILGYDTVRNICLATGIISNFAKPSKDEEVLDYSRFWDHSIGVAVASRMIAKLHGQDTLDNEAFVAGLIHDIGKVVLSQHLSGEYSECLRLTQVENITLLQAEQKILGVNHSDVGGWLAEHWKLPIGMNEAIGYHHIPLVSKQNPELTAIIHFADILVRMAGIGYGGDFQIPAFNSGTQHYVSLSKAPSGDIDFPFYLEILEKEMEQADSLIGILL